jgi:hypothetical protein
MPYLDLEAATGTSSATANTYTSLAAASGDTLTVRTVDTSQQAELIDFGLFAAGTPQARVVSPYLADDVTALSFPANPSDASGLTGFVPTQKLRAQDTLNVQTANGTVSEATAYWQLVWYSDLAGGPSTYISAQELRARAIEQIGYQVTVTVSSALAWQSTLLSAGSGVLKANQTYAVVGYDLNTAVTAIGLYGPDTGNFRAGGPGITTRQFTRNWFYDLSFWTGYSCIPCFNSQNATGTNVQAIAITAVGAIQLNLYLARLK